MDNELTHVGNNSIEGITHSKGTDRDLMGNEYTMFSSPPPEVPESSSESGDEEDYYEINNEIYEIQIKIDTR